ncbi:MAG TPA: superoxide dismutase family protein [Acidimicrobiales bacterium]|nr:superoxide dismutase family protein [Acidimicrobiales bacterium]
MQQRTGWIVAAVAAVVIVGVLAIGGAGASDGEKASAVILGADGLEVGKVRFEDTKSKTRVQVDLRAMPKGAALEAFHGFHIHANSDPANGSDCVADATKAASTWFVSADGHLNTTSKTHGDHTGDMPSVFVNNDATVSMTFEIDRIPVSDLGNRVVILHANPDNFGNVPVGTADDQYTAAKDAMAKTQGTGNAGDRIACGVITVGK